MTRTESLKGHNPRATDARMKSAKQRETQNVMQRRTLKVINKCDLPYHANILPGSFLLGIKFEMTGKKSCEACYVIGSHRDLMRGMMGHISVTLPLSSVRSLLCIAAISRFRIRMNDLRQAYAQILELLSREVYLKNPCKEFGLQKHPCLELLKSLCGLGRFMEHNVG